MKLLAWADHQMDAHPQYGGPEGRLAEQEQILRDILELARDENVGAVLFGGDAFQHRQPSPDAILTWERPLVEHRDAGGPPIFALVGNHDVRNASSACALDAFHLAGLLTLYREPAIHELGEGVWLAALPWAPVHGLVTSQNGGSRDHINEQASEYLHTIAAELARKISEAGGETSILLTHFAIAGDEDGLDAFVREPMLDPDLLSETFDLTVAGHYERAQTIRANVIYCGSPYPVDMGQGAYIHGCWIFEVAGGGFASDFRPLEYRPLETIDLDTIDEPDHLNVLREIENGFL